MTRQIEYDPQKDHYSLLGISPDSGSEEIRLMWRKKAFELHPDRAKNSDCEIKNMNEAYSILKDPEKRKAYNRKRALYIAKTFKFKDTGVPEQYNPFTNIQSHKSHSHFSALINGMKEVIGKVLRR